VAGDNALEPKGKQNGARGKAGKKKEKRRQRQPGDGQRGTNIGRKQQQDLIVVLAPGRPPTQRVSNGDQGLGEGGKNEKITAKAPPKPGWISDRGPTREGKKRG